MLLDEVFCDDLPPGFKERLLAERAARRRREQREITVAWLRLAFVVVCVAAFFLWA